MHAITSIPCIGRYNNYYVGEMSLFKAKGKGKRFVIWPWSISHSMLLFRGKVFEWGINRTYYMRRDPSSCYIKWRSRSEGSSRCTLNDAKRWTRKYGRKNTYNLLFNNCHMFVNALANYLKSNCGRWLFTKSLNIWIKERFNGLDFWDIFLFTILI